MNKIEAIEFAIASAEMAWDQRFSSDYADSNDAIDSYRDNVRDTLNDEKSSEWDAEALAAFDHRIDALRSKSPRTL